MAEPFIMVVVLGMIRHIKLMFMLALSHLHLINAQEQDYSVPHPASYVIAGNLPSPSLVPVPTHLSTASIKKRLPVQREEKEDTEIHGGWREVNTYLAGVSDGAKFISSLGFPGGGNANVAGPSSCRSTRNGNCSLSLPLNPISTLNLLETNAISQRVLGVH
ncbi:hypothetical protein RJ640_019174 [Escallonia rubra]|uniref:Uncharacterized protein n=1 Tax=Escallonia rubra TaxID=112253 RepID=A0AA88RB13_9ASTE|nr:hypothetical protein RJ640_019174 [Escallonia rubra]